MKLQNSLICSNCGADNALYEKNCTTCKHYVRAAVVNIDLWKTIYQLFESPQKALTNIIWAEHKNFIMFLLAFIGIKLFISAAIIQSAFELIIPHTQNFIVNLLALVGIYLVTILVFTKLLTIVLKFRNKTRFKDNLSIIVYSFIPAVLALCILTPVEYGLFGNHWFIYNPSPFLIKNTLAYTLTAIEFILLIWSIALLFIGIRIQSNSKLFAFIATIIFYLILSVEIIIIPFIIL